MLHRTLALSRGLAAACCALLLTMVMGCASKQNPWLAPDQGQFLVEKVKGNYYAYLRYAEAEEEARRDNNAPAAERYREAKEASRKEYERYNQELKEYQASHPSKGVAGRAF